MISKTKKIIQMKRKKKKRKVRFLQTQKFPIWNFKKILQDDEDKEDALPVSTWKPPMTIPTEERGTGSNKYTFFVCNKVSLEALESSNGAKVLF